MSEPSEALVSDPYLRPLGHDGKQLLGPQQMQQVMDQSGIAQQRAQDEEGLEKKRNNVEKAGLFFLQTCKHFLMCLIHEHL